MMAPEQHPANYASTTDARKRLAEQNGDHVPHWDPAVVQLIEQARAEGAAEALREAAAEFRTYAGSAWGGDQTWLTTGNRVADLVADWLDAALRGPR